MKKVNKKFSKLKCQKKLENFDFNKNLNRCFNVKDESFEKMFEIINNARGENRGLKVEKNYNIHHIIPRSYFKKIKLPVYNDEENLVKLTLPEHFMVHYYAWKCSTYIRREMATAFHLMLSRSLQNLKNAPSLTIEQIAHLSIETERIKDKEISHTEKIEYLKTKSKTKYIKFLDDNHLEFQCIKCGKIEKRCYDKNTQYDLCAFCIRSTTHNGLVFTDRKYPKEGVILCACVSDEFGCFWKLISYRLDKPANIKELKMYYEQCDDLCDKTYMIKIYTDKSKEELTEYFNKKFGYKRSYLYFRNVYLKEFVIEYNDKLIFHDSIDEKEWVRLQRLCRLGRAFRIPRYQLELLYGYYRKDKEILKRLKKILDKMVEINDGKDICDYRKEVKGNKK